MSADTLTPRDRSTATFRQRLLAEPSLETLLSTVDALEIREDEALLALVGETALIAQDVLAAELSERQVAFSGATFPAGAFTIGEISSHGSEYLERFNKTRVTGVLH